MRYKISLEISGKQKKPTDLSAGSQRQSMKIVAPFGSSSVPYGITYSSVGQVALRNTVSRGLPLSVMHILFNCKTNIPRQEESVKKYLNFTHLRNCVSTLSSLYLGSCLFYKEAV